MTMQSVTAPNLEKYTFKESSNEIVICESEWNINKLYSCYETQRNPTPNENVDAEMSPYLASFRGTIHRRRFCYKRQIECTSVQNGNDIKQTLTVLLKPRAI